MKIIQQIELLFRRRTVSRRRTQRAVRRRSPAPTPSDPFLLTIWNTLREEYFPELSELASYTVTWSSRRQKRVLASCNIRQRRVVVARELFEPSACRWISAVLYHELCHAAIGEQVQIRGGRRQWHGRQFRELEARHPDIQALEMWIKSGGWAMAVRANRSRQVWARRNGAPV